jgi:hypothetical protein
MILSAVIPDPRRGKDLRPTQGQLALEAKLTRHLTICRDERHKQLAVLSAGVSALPYRQPIQQVMDAAHL